MTWKCIKSILIICFVRLADADEDDKKREMLNVLPTQRGGDGDRFVLDVNESDDIAEINRIVQEYGMDKKEKILDIAGILSAVPGIIHSGDRRRWTMLNLGYQLACYSGFHGFAGSFFTQAIWAFTRFGGYGCYCGPGEYTGNYVDATDRCCKTHDACYTRVMKKYNLRAGCHTVTVPYSVSCCKDQKYTKCTDSGPRAGRELCVCDQQMARCVARNSRTYNSRYNHNRDRCRGRNTLNIIGELTSCRTSSTPTVRPRITYGSQGRCPRRITTGWLWGK